jgi:hypothetical protein
MKNVYLIAGIILWVLAVVMVILSVRMGGMPPGITGIGFLVIGWVFIRKGREKDG